MPSNPYPRALEIPDPHPISLGMTNLMIGLLFGIAAAAILAFMWRRVGALRVELRDQKPPANPDEICDRPGTG